MDAPIDMVFRLTFWFVKTTLINKSFLIFKPFSKSLLYTLIENAFGITWGKNDVSWKKFHKF